LFRSICEGSIGKKERKAEAPAAENMLPEIQKLRKTIEHWFDKICNFHVARVTNAPTEAMNNLIKRIGFGFRNFANYPIRVLHYAGKPNWRVLGSIVVK
jgi:transposase